MLCLLVSVFVKRKTERVLNQKGSLNEKLTKICSIFMLLFYLFEIKHVIIFDRFTSFFFTKINKLIKFELFFKIRKSFN